MLQERRATLTDERDAIAKQLEAAESEPIGPDTDDGKRRRAVADDNELWRIIGELRGDMRNLERRVDELCRQIEKSAISGMPPYVLYAIVLIGVLLVLLLSYMSIRGFPG